MTVASHAGSGVTVKTAGIGAGMRPPAPPDAGTPRDTRYPVKSGGMR